MSKAFDFGNNSAALLNQIWKLLKLFNKSQFQHFDLRLHNSSSMGGPGANSCATFPVLGAGAGTGAGKGPGKGALWTEPIANTPLKRHCLVSISLKSI